MADAVQVRTNLPDFKRQLDAFKADMQQNIVRNATRAAAKVFKEAVIAMAPVLRTPRKGRVVGLLRNSIYVKADRKTKPGTVRYIVGFKKSKRGDPFYGRFLEEGWVPRGRGQRLRGGSRYKRLERKRATAAGRKVQHAFIAPAARRAASAALEAFKTKMQQGLDKAAKKTSAP
jgi:HK97 gp10 family phage protein